MTIGENLRRLRKERGLTQEVLAAAIGVSAPMIAQIERGTKALTLPLAVEIASEMECDIREFIS